MDFKAAREARNLTLKQVSELAEYSIPTINALELEGRGSDRLRAKLAEIYGGPQSQSQTQALRETPAEYKVDDLLEEIKRMREQLGAVERAAKRLKS